MTTPDRETDTELLLNAYVDGELDAASALAFDRRLAAEPELAAARDRIVALRGVLHDNLPREAASHGLRRAMAAQAGTSRGGMSQVSAWARAAQLHALNVGSRLLASERRMALAACLVGAFFGAGITGLVLNPRAPAPVMAEVVSDHLRAVMAPQPFDVASSDEHTVKPWFTGRLPFAPQVFDLPQAGFTLVGGRVDVLDGQPAAALVFRHGKHLISLISQPSGPVAPQIDGGAADRGFQVRDWVTGGMHYWAVSDIASDELDAFEAAARAELQSAK